MYIGYVLINCDLGAEEYVADEVRKISQVVEVQLTFGAYDIVAKVRTSDQDEFDAASQVIRYKDKRLPTVEQNA